MQFLFSTPERRLEAFFFFPLDRDFLVQFLIRLNGEDLSYICFLLLYRNIKLGLM